MNVIQLTRLNNQPLAVNSDLIKFVENAHDTVVTLVNGEKIVVRESVEDVIERVIAFRRGVLSALPSAGANIGLAAFEGQQPEPSVNDSQTEGNRHG